MSNILDKFYGYGIRRGLFSDYAGYITHLNDNSAVVYDKFGQFSGRIDIYGDTVYIKDNEGITIETGTYYENTNSISVFDNREGYYKKEVTYNNGSSYVTNRFDLTDVETMYSSDCCETAEYDDYLETGWIDDIFED